MEAEQSHPDAGMCFNIEIRALIKAQMLRLLDGSLSHLQIVNGSNDADIVISTFNMSSSLPNQF